VGQDSDPDVICSPVPVGQDSDLDRGIHAVRIGILTHECEENMLPKYQYAVPLLILASAFTLAQDAPQEKLIGPVRVKIQDEKPVIFEPVLPLDPVKRVEYQFIPQNLGLNVKVENKMLHLGFMFTQFKIDEQIQFVQVQMQQRPLPKTPGGKDRDGMQCDFNMGQLRVTKSVEVIATRPGKEKQRRRDAVLVRYLVHNLDKVPHKVAMRIHVDVFIVNNDGALFAAPNQPGKILDGVTLEGKMVPDFLQMLERPNLADPGFVAHYTFALGGGIERPSRLVLTSLRADFGNGWNPQAMPAGGDSAMAILWDPKEIKPGAKMEMGYALGQGVAYKVENEGVTKVDLTGSFEPGKLFTINALVSDPSEGQSLTLELPAGMERMEGKETQAVPAIDAEGNCLVQWKARVLETGRFPLRVHSSTGTTQTKIITITPAK